MSLLAIQFRKKFLVYCVLPRHPLGWMPLLYLQPLDFEPILDDEI